MTYTLWSRGRLLGESPLDFVRCMPNLRVGFLHPTPLGEKLLPVACGASPASVAWGRALREAKVKADEKAFFMLPEYADYRSACDEEAAMALELRGPGGEVIPTEDIAVRDTEWVLATFGEKSTLTEEEISDADAPKRNAGQSTDENPDAWDDSDDADLSEEEMVAELEALSVDDAADLAWRPPREERQWMRYQLQVTLIHDWSIP